jgi:hypothetical protein
VGIERETKMATYMVTYGETPTDRFKVYAFENRADALRLAGIGPLVRNGDCAVVIGNAEDVTFSGKLLVAVFNAMTDSGIKKFENRAIGVDRLMKVLPTVAEEVKMEQYEENETATTDVDKPALGEFKRVREDSHLGRIVGAAFNGSLTVAQIAAKTGRGTDQVKSHLKRARVTHGIDHDIDATGVVTVTIPAGEKVFKEPKAAPEAKEPRAFKAPNVGREFVPVREGTRLAKVAESAAKGGMTYEEIAADTDFDLPQVKQMLRHSLALFHGVGHTADEGGVIALEFPEGKTAADLVKERAEPKEKAESDGTRMQSKTKEVFEAAQRGVRPVKPVVTSQTNLHRQKWFDKLEAMADANDWDGVRALDMKGIDSYSKMINRYRDQLLTAHEAGEREAA